MTEGWRLTVLARFFRDEDGATAIEYGLIAAAMAVGLIAAFTVFGDALLAMFEFVRDESSAAMNLNTI